MKIDNLKNKSVVTNPDFQFKEFAWNNTQEMVNAIKTSNDINEVMSAWNAVTKNPKILFYVHGQVAGTMTDIFTEGIL